MECVEGALKTSFRAEIALKTSPQVVFDDFWGFNVQNVTTCDDFFVDELLNFSNEDGLVEEEEEQEPEGDKGFGSVSPKKQTQDFDHSDSSSKFSHKDDFGSVPSSELNLPAEDMAELEWLSQFVDDSENSFSEFSAPYATVILPVKAKNQMEKAPEPESPALKTPVPAKIRSKRIRTGGRVWSLGSTPLPESSSSSNTSSCSLSPPSSPWLIYTSMQDYEPAEAEKEKHFAKKLRKKPGSLSSGSVQPPRSCGHCGVHKTPQWRAGPLGAKTLCNACGVRYKSGRLLPEYRPACSPTFSSELHSNHHRRVLEMRSKKVVVSNIPESGLTPSVVPTIDPNPN